MRRPSDALSALLQNSESLESAGATQRQEPSDDARASSNHPASYSAIQRARCRAERLYFEIRSAFPKKRGRGIERTIPRRVHFDRSDDLGHFNIYFTFCSGIVHHNM